MSLRLYVLGLFLAGVTILVTVVVLDPGTVPVPIGGGVLLAVALAASIVITESFPVWWSPRTSTSQVADVVPVAAALVLNPRMAAGAFLLGGLLEVIAWRRRATGDLLLDRGLYRLGHRWMLAMLVVVAVQVVPAKPMPLLVAATVGAVLSAAISAPITAIVVAVSGGPRIDWSSEWRTWVLVSGASGVAGGLIAFAAVPFGGSMSVVVMAAAAGGIVLLSKAMERAYLATTAMSDMLTAAGALHLAGGRAELERSVAEMTQRVLGTPGRLGQAEDESVLVLEPTAVGRTLHRIETPLVRGLEGLLATALANLELREQVAYVADHDELTGLPNRRATLRHLDQALDRAGRSGGDVIVVFIDLDGLKRVNDEDGHEAGDRLIVHAAQTLSRACRTSELAGRLGGDEFLVILESSQPDPSSVGTAVTRISQVLEGAGIEASVGVALQGRDGQGAKELVAAADERMYEHKEARRAVETER